jgi:hypothetical protein
MNKNIITFDANVNVYRHGLELMPQAKACISDAISYWAGLVRYSVHLRGPDSHDGFKRGVAVGLRCS